MLEKNFPEFDLIYPADQLQLMEAIYGQNGIKNGYFDGISLEQLVAACNELVDKGCTLILPGITELSLVCEQLWKRGIPILDVNQVYADFVIENENPILKKPFKLGIVGGVGPSATVDFMNKVIRNTPAKRDQDHIKMVVEQNPQIPDRTGNLVYKETDPTIAMFSTCKRLEAEGADAIAIPCNTAHAFVKGIQEHLSIPIINMLTKTAEHLTEAFGNNKRIGLLATSGTLQSKVYHDVLNEFGFEVIAPDEERQRYVMESIYGESGVKAGYTDGQCKEYILKAAHYLIDKGVEAIILGCTELPLLFPVEDHLVKNEVKVALVDPTLLLAKCIVERAIQSRES